MRHLRLMLVALASALSMSAVATERMYGVAALGYAEGDFSQRSADDLTYKLAIAHQFHRQWYVELGYQRLYDLSTDGAEQDDLALQADVLAVSLLGKASGQVGELFYRLGLANVDVAGYEYAQDGQCALGNQVADTSMCYFDEGVWAGVVGVGFDYHLGINTMLRMEVEYFQGDEDFKSTAAYIGIRYNFN